MRIVARALSSIIFALLLLAVGTPAYAHERWFVDHGGQHVGESQWIDWLNVLLIGVGVLLLVSIVLIDRSKWYGKVERVLEKWRQVLPRGIEWRAAAVLVAAALIFNAVMGVFLAPDLQLPGLTVSAATSSYWQVPRALLAGDSPLHLSPALIGSAAQLLLALILLSQVSFMIPGVLIIIVALPLVFTYLEPDYWLDYVAEFLAVGLAFILAGIAITPLDRRIAARLKLDVKRLSPLALPVIRIGLGASLVVVALHNKLLDPNMALSFLDKHNFNFMPLLGFANFSNIRFVFAAGVVEVTVGVLLIMGIATRLVSALTFLLMSITMGILGPIELSGHLPIMGVELLLIYRGSGGLALTPRVIKQWFSPRTNVIARPVAETSN